VLLLLRLQKIGQLLLCGQPEPKTVNSGSSPTGDSLSTNNMNLVRFAHNWNSGMLEYWNDGFKEKINAHIFALMV
jgi:hypothetical protein